MDQNVLLKLIFMKKIKTKFETLKVDTAERGSTPDIGESKSDDPEELDFLKINNDKPRNSLHIRNIDTRILKIPRKGL